MKYVKYIKTDAPSRPYISIPFITPVHNARKRMHDLVSSHTSRAVHPTGSVKLGAPNSPPHPTWDF